MSGEDLAGKPAEDGHLLGRLVMTPASVYRVIRFEDELRAWLMPVRLDRGHWLRRPGGDLLVARCALLAYRAIFLRHWFWVPRRGWTRVLPAAFTRPVRT